MSRIPLTQEDVIQRFKEVHGDRYDYTNTKYENTRTYLEIGCRIHGLFWQTPRCHWAGCGCPKCYSESRKRPISGAGINDLGNGSLNDCYITWRNLIRRCYNSTVQKKSPTYIGCSVCDEWLIYSNFKAWFDENYVEGYHLDKDILVKGNKVYSPQTCCFVPQRINLLITNRKRFRGNYPLGVSLHGHRYRAAFYKNGTRINIGTFDTSEAAFLAYKKAKEQYVKVLAEKYYKEGKITERVYNALLAYEVEITD